MLSPLHITVCVCTFKRAKLLQKLLEKLQTLRTEGDFTYSCVVVDNDAEASARGLVESLQNKISYRLVYVTEPERNFALVRNAAIANASGDFIAFIDDDEVPVEEWLLKLLEIQKKHNADGVLGPVRPYFDNNPPAWLVKSKLCERPVHPTGMVLPWNQCRTGNVLLKRDIFIKGLKFDPAYRTGGEDVDFFKRAMKVNYKFVWCEEAPAYELVPPERCTKKYHLKRALLQGRISLKYATDKLTLTERLKIGFKAFLATLVYTLCIPFLALAGFHVAMKYLIKDCHHIGRLLAILGIEPIKQRNF